MTYLELEYIYHEYKQRFVYIRIYIWIFIYLLYIGDFKFSSFLYYLNLEIFPILIIVFLVITILTNYLNIILFFIEKRNLIYLLNTINKIYKNLFFFKQI